MTNTEELIQFFTKKRKVKLTNVLTGESRFSFSGEFDTFKMDYDLLDKFLPEVSLDPASPNFIFRDATVKIGDEVIVPENVTIEFIEFVDAE